MYRPGVGVDPWYENFKFFLTYWLLSSNNRDRASDIIDQLPPPPPPGSGTSFVPPPTKSQSDNPNSDPNQKSADSPSQGLPSPWNSLDKQTHSPRQNLLDGYGAAVKHLGLQPSQSGLGPIAGPGVGGQLGPVHSPVKQGRPPDYLVAERDRRHVCPHCYKGFRSRQQLNQHNLVHSGLRKYHCLYCERSFKQLSHLQQHHRIHTGEKPYRCPMDGCDKAFAQMSNLQHHMRQHDKATFGQKHCMCPFCDRGYASEKSLKSHLSKMHPDAKIFGLGSPSTPDDMASEGHAFYDSPRGDLPLPHRPSLPSMHHSMKSPGSTPSGMAGPGLSRPLELTVSHQKDAGHNLDNGENSKYDSLMTENMSEKYLPRGPPNRPLDSRDHSKMADMFDQRFGISSHSRDINKYGRTFESFSPSQFPSDSQKLSEFKNLDRKYFGSEKLQRMAENFHDFRARFQDHVNQINCHGDSLPSQRIDREIPSLTDSDDMNYRNDFHYGDHDGFIPNRQYHDINVGRNGNFHSENHVSRVANRSDIVMNTFENRDFYASLNGDRNRLGQSHGIRLESRNGDIPVRVRGGRSVDYAADNDVPVHMVSGKLLSDRELAGRQLHADMELDALDNRGDMIVDNNSRADRQSINGRGGAVCMDIQNNQPRRLAISSKININGHSSTRMNTCPSNLSFSGQNDFDMNESQHDPESDRDIHMSTGELNGQINGRMRQDDVKPQIDDGHGYHGNHIDDHITNITDLRIQKRANSQLGAPPNGHMNGIDVPHDQDNSISFTVDTGPKSTSPIVQNADSNIIRQHKRKPSNPQHVFMPSIDRYANFTSDEIDDCSNLVLDGDNGFNRKLVRNIQQD